MCFFFLTWTSFWGYQASLGWCTVTVALSPFAFCFFLILAGKGFKGNFPINHETNVVLFSSTSSWPKLVVFNVRSISIHRIFCSGFGRFHLPGDDPCIGVHLRQLLLDGEPLPSLTLDTARWGMGGNCELWKENSEFCYSQCLGAILTGPDSRRPKSMPLTCLVVRVVGL